VADGVDRHRVRCEVRDGRSEQVISDGQDPVCLRVWAAEQAEAPASRGGDANKGTSTVDQGAAKPLELSLCIDDREVAVVRGQDRSPLASQSGRKRNGSVVVDGGEGRKPLENVSDLGD